MGVLEKTKCYTIGPMEFTSDGRSWREAVKARLTPRNIRILDPWHHPFVNGFKDEGEAQERMKTLREQGNYDELAKTVKVIRSDDLRMCDLSDFFIFYLSVKVFTCGSFEEFFWANRIKKPIFLVVKEGKRCCPLWIFGTIPHKYIYDSLDEALNVIEDIDDGRKEIDSARWRLFNLELR